MSAQVKVLCGDPAHANKRAPRLARYELAASGVFERVDRHGSNDDWFIKGATVAELAMYPRPHFPCPCGRDEVFDHDTLQRKLQEAADSGKPLVI